MATNHFNMDKVNYGYSMKNIGSPSKMDYLMNFLSSVHDFIGRVRWRTYHIKNPGQHQDRETYGFNTKKPPPIDKDLELFEKNMIDLCNRIEFREKHSRFRTKLKEDQRNIKQEPKLIIAADKTSN